MTQPSSVESIFSAALQKDSAQERAAFLNEACAGNDDLRRQVQRLLDAVPKVGSFMAKPFAPTEEEAGAEPARSAPAAATLPPRPVSEGSGTRIGPYKLLQKIGEGGMGVVYMAEQEHPIRRRVALKIIKPGMDSTLVIARFEAERQALAMMDYLNIARVLDAGTTESGRPYFVMELVQGVPITHYCDENKLSLKERLELFIPVCRAMQHAHQKGIIHRDVKPSNVLVTLYDGKPVPKVIDFGVAKAIEQKLTERTMFTQYRAIVGTLEYMAPEQAEMSGLGVDTRSDIYSLGVLLYELLTGTTPVEQAKVRELTYIQLLRMIQEDEPPKPSTRLSTTQQLATIAAQRRTGVRELAKQVRGELDWIVMKALEKDRTRRYETASGLARDVERFLHDEPVEAGPPSARYRLRKFAHRYRRGLQIAGAFALLLVAGAAFSAWEAVQARRAAQAALAQRDRAVAAEAAATVARSAEAAQRQKAEVARDDKEKARSAAETNRVAAGRARDDAERALYFNRINLAYQYWLGNHLDQSNRILQLCPAALRGWEWRYLDRLHHADLLTLPRNGEFAADLQVNKDGNRLAAFTPYGDAGVRVWDPKQKTRLAEIRLMKTGRGFTCAALSADGKIVALGDQSGAITFWDSETGKLARQFTKLPKSVNSLSFSPDGRWLAAARADVRNGEMLLPFLEAPRSEDLIVWEVAGAKEIFHPKGYGFGVEFSPDGSRLLTLRRNTALRLHPSTPEVFVALFDTKTWTVVAPDKLGFGSFLSFSGDGKRLAIGGFHRLGGANFLRIVDPADGKELFSLPVSRHGVVALNADGTLLALGEALGSSQIEIWNVDKRAQIGTLRGHSSWIEAVVFTSDGRLASSSRDGTVKLWDPNGSQDVRQITRPSVSLAAPALLCPGGSLLAYGQSNTAIVLLGAIKAVSLVDVATSRITHTLAGHDGGAVKLAFNGDGNRLASGGRSGDVKIWDVHSGSLLCTIPETGQAVAGLALSFDGRQVATSHEPKEFAELRQGRGSFPIKIPVTAINVFNAEDGKLRVSLPGNPNMVEQIAFSPDGKFLASASYQLLRLWDLSTGVLLKEFKQGGELRSGTSDFLVFNESGSLLATAGSQTIQLWDVASRRSLAFFQGHAFVQLTGVAISPDSSRLATCGAGEVKLWDIHSGQEILNLPLPQPEAKEQLPRVGSLAWTSDGQRLRAALTNGAVIEWDGSAKTVQ